jgi:hypothetical protein
MNRCLLGCAFNPSNKSITHSAVGQPEKNSLISDCIIGMHYWYLGIRALVSDVFPEIFSFRIKPFDFSLRPWYTILTFACPL